MLLVVRTLHDFLYRDLAYCSLSPAACAAMKMFRHAVVSSARGSVLHGWFLGQMRTIFSCYDLDFSLSQFLNT